MDWTERRRRFRAILAGTRCVRPASVFDAVSARIAEDLGFEAGMFAGSVASLAVLGAPDLIVVTLTEFAEQAYRICRAGNLPLLVDADHGYGNALNVMRTVQELETSGVAATVKLPILLGGAGAELDDAAYLGAKGVRVCLQGHLPIMAAIRAVHDTLKALREGAKPAEIAGVASEALMQQVTRDKDYKGWIKEFLS